MTEKSLKLRKAEKIANETSVRKARKLWRTKNKTLNPAAKMLERETVSKGVFDGDKETLRFFNEANRREETAGLIAIDPIGLY